MNEAFTGLRDEKVVLNGIFLKSGRHMTFLRRHKQNRPRCIFYVSALSLLPSSAHS